MKTKPFQWKDLHYWATGEWQVVQEHLRDITKTRAAYCPGRKNLFRALDATPFDKVKVVIMGQDPYPNLLHATGVAFEVPEGTRPFPQTLLNILKELRDDLGYQGCTGPLTKWTEQGVLLWNAFPSCMPGKPGSHNWSEWEYLTKEIVQKVSAKGAVFAFLGNRARDFAVHVDTNNSEVLLTSHPSPRGNLKSKNPFNGSRIFSTINAKLVEHGIGEMIDWRL